MDIFLRSLYSRLLEALEPNKVLLLYGPRRVGKTTLLQELSANLPLKIKFVDGEDRNIQHIFSSQVIHVLRNFLQDTELLILDEAQKIPDIGTNLKLIVDHIPNIRIIASGSASFSLAQKVGEPLTGRKKTFHLFPLSLSEVLAFQGMENAETFTKNQFMIFGGYPETFRLSDDEKAHYLKEIIDSYLFKDILEIENIRSPKKLRDLLTLLAFQIGSEVSLSELGRQLEIHKDTVMRYLDLLEKSFVIVNIRGFSRNLRKEVTKSSRYYFYDNGIRNALINNFNHLPLRSDTGQLWENFLVMERLKKQQYSNIIANNYFWRTYDQQEIDWVEEMGGKLFGYEIKWNSARAKNHPPSAWLQTYPQAEFECITNANYLPFIL